MSDHGEERFLEIVLADPTVAAVLERAPTLGLRDWWLTAGVLFQTVWNSLTGRPPGAGIRDADFFYFDPDTSWEAEDAVIRKLGARLASPGATIEARNQARVHLWYGQKHGLPYPPVRCSTEGIDRFLTANTMVGIRRIAGGYESYAPNGFDDIAAMVVRPNPGPNFSAGNYTAKVARWKRLWPEITVIEPDA